MTTATELLARVESAGGRLEVHGNRLAVEAPEPLPVDLLGELRRHKADLLRALEADPLVVFRGRIAIAQNWADLRVILADAEVAFAEGDLTGVKVERVARLCALVARRLPECASEDTNGPRVYADEVQQPNRCSACGRAEWWRDGYGNRKCAVCHPPPRRGTP